jgi:hypothetical protein
MLSSAVRSFEGMGMFPKNLANEDFIAQIPSIFPDVAAHYGADAKYTVQLDIHDIYPNFIAFNKTMFLGRDDPLMLEFNVYANDELAVTFIDEVAFRVDFEAQAFIANFKLDAFIVRQINSFPNYANANITDSQARDFAHHALFSAQQTVNTALAGDIDIFAKINPIVGQIVDMFLPNCTISPYQESEYLYLGINTLAPGNVPKGFNIMDLF